MQRLQIVLLACALVVFPILAEYGLTLAALEMLLYVTVFIAVVLGGIRLLVAFQRPAHNSGGPEL